MWDTKLSGPRFWTEFSSFFEIQNRYGLPPVIPEQEARYFNHVGRKISGIVQYKIEDVSVIQIKRRNKTTFNFEYISFLRLTTKYSYIRRGLYADKSDSFINLQVNSETRDILTEPVSLKGILIVFDVSSIIVSPALTYPYDIISTFFVMVIFLSSDCACKSRVYLPAERGSFFFSNRLAWFFFWKETCFRQNEIKITGFCL